MIRKYKTISYWQNEDTQLYSECKYWVPIAFRMIEFNAQFTVAGKNSIAEVKKQINYQLNELSEDKSKWSEMSAAYCKQQSI